MRVYKGFDFNYFQYWNYVNRNNSFINDFLCWLSTGKNFLLLDSQSEAKSSLDVDNKHQRIKNLYNQEVFFTTGE